MPSLAGGMAVVTKGRMDSPCVDVREGRQDSCCVEVRVSLEMIDTDMLAKQTWAVEHVEQTLVLDRVGYSKLTIVCFLASVFIALLYVSWFAFVFLL